MRLLTSSENIYFSFPSFLFPLLISIMFIIFNRETPSRECFSNVWQSSEVWFNSVLPPNLIIMSFFALPQQPRRFQLAWGLLKVFLCVLLIWKKNERVGIKKEKILVLMIFANAFYYYCYFLNSSIAILEWEVYRQDSKLHENSVQM